MAKEPAPIQLSFTFYPSDVEALTTLTAGLRRAGLKYAGAPLRANTVLRALIRITPAKEMFDKALMLARAYEEKQGPREAENVASHPSIVVPKDDVDKLDGVVTDLYEKNVIATRAHIMRALLRGAPAPEMLVPAVKKFLTDNPAKPSGWRAASEKKRG